MAFSFLPKRTTRYEEKDLLLAGFFFRPSATISSITCAPHSLIPSIEISLPSRVHSSTEKTTAERDVDDSAVYAFSPKKLSHDHDYQTLHKLAPSVERAPLQSIASETKRFVHFNDGRGISASHKLTQTDRDLIPKPLRPRSPHPQSKSSYTSTNPKVGADVAALSGMIIATMKKGRNRRSPILLVPQPATNHEREKEVYSVITEEKPIDVAVDEEVPGELRDATYVRIVKGVKILTLEGGKIRSKVFGTVRMN